MRGGETSDGIKVNPMTRGSQDSQGPLVKSGDRTMVCRLRDVETCFRMRGRIICENTIGGDTLWWWMTR